MKFIKKMIIDNFQSHLHTELDFELGLNVIVGQSDKGKSAVIRALKWVLYNEPRGSDFVRHGTNECSVTIITSDNFSITRRRKSSKNIYIIITPEEVKLEFENFGNDTPQEVYDAMGMRKIKLDTDTESKINLNEQLDPPFLLSETGSMRAKTIGRIVNTNIIDAAERDILKDISNDNVTVKNIEKQILDIDEELKEYADIDKYEKNIEQIDKLFEKLVNTNSKSEKLSEQKTKLDSINHSIANDNILLSQLKSLPITVDLFNSLKEKYSHYQKLHQLKDKLDSVNNDIDSDKQVLNRVLHVDKASDILKEIDTKMLDSKKISDLNEKLKDINARIDTGILYRKNIDSDFKHRVSDYGKLLKQLGKCPTCFNPISDNILEHIICEMEGEINDVK